MANIPEDPMEYYRTGPELSMPREDRLPAEDRLPKEEAYSFDEFNEQPFAAPRQSEEKDLGKRLKQLLLKPVIAGLSLTTLVFSAFGLDPLQGSSVAEGNLAPETSVSVSTEAPPAETTEPPQTSTAAPETTTEPVTTEPVTTEPETTEPETTEPLLDEGFPELENLDPDYAGNATEGRGPEQFIRYLGNGDRSYSYLIMGTSYEEATEGAGEPEAGRRRVSNSPEISYDTATNVLTLSHFSGDELSINLMGNGFTIRLVGENRIGQLIVWGYGYGGSLTVLGDGTLNVSDGLLMFAEASQTCLMVGRGVTLNLSGQVPLLIQDTSMEQALYLSPFQRMEGGEMVSFESEYAGPDYLTFVPVTEEGNLASSIVIQPIH